MIVLGVDPGLANTGWGIVVDAGGSQRCLAYGCVSTTPKDDLAQRLKQIHNQIGAVIARYNPQEVSVESIFFGTNAKSAFATGQARGVILLATADAGLGLGEYSPVQIKKAIVGTGRAEKEQVQFMVKEVLRLDHTPKPDHAADALAAALCHLQLYSRKELERRIASEQQSGADKSERRAKELS